MKKSDILRTATRLATLSTRLTDLVGDIATEPTEVQIDTALDIAEKINLLCGKLERIEGIRKARLQETDELSKLRE